MNNEPEERSHSASGADALEETTADDFILDFLGKHGVVVVEYDRKA